MAAWVILGFCFSVSRILEDWRIFPVALLTLGLGFIFHELSHKFTAQKFGCLAEFRLWWWGLILALVLAVASGGRVIFAAPGAVYIFPFRLSSWGYGITRRENGLISIAGPAANIAIALLFLSLSYHGGIMGVIGYNGFMINLWLAAFNMLPFSPLDGGKVLSWNPIIWALVAIPLWIFMFQPFLFF